MGLSLSVTYGSHCIVLARCERLALSSITMLRVAGEHGGDRYD
jgi:hypothetical protein